MRLIQNNSIALSLYVPQWIHPELTLEEEEELEQSFSVPESWGWFLDISIGNSPNVAGRWDGITKKFQKTILALYILHRKYQGRVIAYQNGEEISADKTPDIFRHASRVFLLTI